MNALDQSPGGSGLAPFILIKSAGEMASAIAVRLHKSNMGRICMLDLPEPLAVRRRVSFCPALDGGSAEVEGVGAVAVRNAGEMEAAWKQSQIAVMLTTDWSGLADRSPDVVIDAVLAKRNLGTDKNEAPLVIALGPGFEAGRDCHLVIETNRGHDLGRLISSGPAAVNTGIPGAIAGETENRVVRAPVAGRFDSTFEIGDDVRAGTTIGHVAGEPVVAKIGGVLRGLIKPGTDVSRDLKLGDIDPRGDNVYCGTISDKARTISGAVLEGVLSQLNQPASRC